MATRIRLQRHGKKGKAFFHVVVADARARRDGRYIERLGIYNPNTNPATIELNFDRALKWVKDGAQPSDTAKAMLKYRGVIYKNHLDKGVAKGALTQAQADAKFEKWLQDKDATIKNKVDSIAKLSSDEAKKRLSAETEVKENRAKEISAKNSAMAAEAAAVTENVAEEAASTEEETTETASAEVAQPEAAEEAAPAPEAKAEEPVAADEEKTEE